MATARGLEKIHRPIGDTFAAADAGRFRLLAVEVEAYERNGFVAGVDVLTPAQVLLLRDRLESIRARARELEPELYEVEAGHLARPEEVIFHFLGAWLVDEVFHDLLFAPAVTVPCAQLLRVDRLRFWHDQVFAKPPHHPGVVPWHQDWSYWTRVGPARHLTMNIMLDDADAANGCVHFVPGSHRWPLLPKTDFGGGMDQALDHLGPRERAAFHPVAAPLRAGQATIHHSHTVHGSFANRSDRPRRAVVLNFMAPDTRCLDASEPLLRGVPRIPAGAVVEGDHFPIVFERA